MERSIQKKPSENPGSALKSFSLSRSMSFLSAMVSPWHSPARSANVPTIKNLACCGSDPASAVLGVVSWSDDTFMASDSTSCRLVSWRTVTHGDQYAIDKEVKLGFGIQWFIRLYRQQTEGIVAKKQTSSVHEMRLATWVGSWHQTSGEEIGGFFNSRYLIERLWIFSSSSSSSSLSSSPWVRMEASREEVSSWDGLALEGVGASWGEETLLGFLTCCFPWSMTNLECKIRDVVEPQPTSFCIPSNFVLMVWQTM